MLQVDAYAGYKRLARNEPPGKAVVLANCWAHARRKLVEIQKSSGSPIADEGLKQKRARISAKSRLVEHLTYIANCWGGLQVLLGNGHVEMDNNPVENRIRPLARGRKNHLFAGHDEGVHA